MDKKEIENKIEESEKDKLIRKLKEINEIVELEERLEIMQDDINSILIYTKLAEESAKAGLKEKAFNFLKIAEILYDSTCDMQNYNDTNIYKLSNKRYRYYKYYDMVSLYEEIERAKKEVGQTKMKKECETTNAMKVMQEAKDIEDIINLLRIENYNAYEQREENKDNTDVFAILDDKFNYINKELKDKEKIYKSKDTIHSEMAEKITEYAKTRCEELKRQPYINKKE